MGRERATPPVTPNSTPLVGYRGSWLLVSTGAVLPDRCPKCNEPLAVRKRVKLWWYPPWVHLLALSICVMGILGLLVYAVTASLACQRLKIETGLCVRHRNRRRVHLLIGTGITLAGACVGILAIASWRDLYTGLAGLGAMIVGLLYLNFAMPFLRVKKIERSIAYVTGCSPAFLASLGPTRRCTVCDYDLRGQPEGAELRCPECGTVYATQ